MKLISIIIYLLISEIGYCATPSRYTDGKIEFASATVNGITYWTDQEVIDATNNANIYKSTSPVTVNYYSPSLNEINLSTCPISGFFSYSDYSNLFTNKDALFKKLMEIYNQYQLAISLNDTDKINELKSKLFTLKYIYSSMVK